MTWTRIRLDRDRRRALGLTLLVHATLLLALLLGMNVDVTPREPEETFLVIDLGTPPEAEEEADAPAAEDPAPMAQRPEVAADTQGAPQAGAASDRTETPPPPAPEPEAVPDEEPPAPQAEAAEAEEAPEPAAAAPPPEETPVPSVRTPQAVEPARSPEVPPAPVPEIETPELEPRPLEQEVPVPQPALRAQVPPARDISPVAEASAAEAVPVAAPNARAALPSAVVVPAPSVRAQVPAASAVPTPQPSASAGEGRPVPTPQPSARAGQGRPVPTPQPSVSAGRARAVEPQARAAVTAARDVPQPTMRARVSAPDAGEQVGMAANPPESERPPGGDAPRAGQPNPGPDARADALGRAGSPEGGEGPEGDRSPREPMGPEVRNRPLAVLIDNHRGYPQAGLVQARTVIEMPVEGGITRLMPLFDQRDPPEVGPVRSARPYFVRLAWDLDGILVHDGGSPGALEELQRSAARGGLPTLNAFQRGELFTRSGDRGAPYNLYSRGLQLREAVTSLPVNAQRILEGYRPSTLDEDRPEAGRIDIAWSGDYRSGFRYVAGVDRYRWLRDGDPAVDSSGQPVQVDAVLLARVDARRIPDDPAGRLFIPLDGGEARLYWKGRVHEGTWASEGGLRFVGDEGAEVDLERLVTWAAFVPLEVAVEER